MQTQREIELEAYAFGKERMTKAIAKNEQQGHADSNPYAQAIYRRFVLPLADAIREDISAKRTGRNQAHVQLLRGVDADAAAYIAVRAALTTLLSGVGEDEKRGAARSVASEIGRSVYHEHLLTNFADMQPELFYHLTNDFERKMSKNESYRMTVYKQQAKKAGLELPVWSSGDVTQVGSYIVDRLEQFGMLSSSRMTVPSGQGKSKQYIMVRMTEDTQRLIDQIREFVIEATPYFLPCVEPPKDWTAVNEGGFHTDEMRRLMPWAIKVKPAARDIILATNPQQDLQALNYLQRTPWRINRKMLEAVSQVHQHFDMEEIITQAEKPRPRKPEWLSESMKKEDMDELQLDEFAKWRRNMAEWHTEAKQRGVVWGRFYNAVRVARKFQDYDAIYFVYFMDFRGRKYVQTTGVSPQGSDLQKALLEFAEGEPLDTPDAVRWFKINGANKWGYDKASLDDRAKWVDERHDLLQAFGADPINNTGWTEADKPLQFLAWCMEYAEWKTGIGTFRSRLAVGLDGSCNGLQNFSAMLRDEVGGRATNLVPASLPNDIYQMVADETLRRLQEAGCDEDEFLESLRQRWLKHGISRSLVKRSVMTLPYGSRQSSCAEFIVSDYLRKGTAPEFARTEYGRAARYLARFVWASIGVVVVKAREAMDWLQSSSRAILKGGDDRIMWTTPTGFPVVSIYWKPSIHQIHTKLAGQARLKLHHDTDVPDFNRHKNGIAPNFVHSLDASHLTAVTRACAARGIAALHMIHDDFGTHPRHTQALYEIIRQEFLAMYEERDPMAEFGACYGLPYTPVLGSLDLRQVLDSQYFFS